MTARHDKATQKCQPCRDKRHTNPGEESYACECGERTCACYGLQVRAGVRRDRRSEAMTHDKATGGRTEAAAVDQAIADVRDGLKWHSTTRERNDALAALRVLADAVEELRSERGSAQQARDSCHIAYVGERKLREAAEAERDEAERLYDEAEQRLTAMEAERDRLQRRVERDRYEFSAENVQLAAQVESLRNWIKGSQDYKRAERLARQVADLEAAHGELELHERALALMAKDFAPDLAIRDHRVLEQEYLNRAARSRDPQEGK